MVGVAVVVVLDRVGAADPGVVGPGHRGGVAEGVVGGGGGQLQRRVVRLHRVDGGVALGVERLGGGAGGAHACDVAAGVDLLGGQADQPSGGVVAEGRVLGDLAPAGGGGHHQVLVAEGVIGGVGGLLVQQGRLAGRRVLLLHLEGVLQLHGVGARAQASQDVGVDGDALEDRVVRCPVILGEGGHLGQVRAVVDLERGVAGGVVELGRGGRAGELAGHGVRGEPQPATALQVAPRVTVGVVIGVPLLLVAGGVGGDPDLLDDAATLGDADLRVDGTGAGGVHRAVGQRGVVDLHPGSQRAGADAGQQVGHPTQVPVDPHL